MKLLLFPLAAAMLTTGTPAADKPAPAKPPFPPPGIEQVSPDTIARVDRALEEARNNGKKEEVAEWERKKAHLIEMMRRSGEEPHQPHSPSAETRELESMQQRLNRLRELANSLRQEGLPHLAEALMQQTKPLEEAIARQAKHGLGAEHQPGGPAAEMIERHELALREMQKQMRHLQEMMANLQRQMEELRQRK